METTLEEQITGHYKELSKEEWIEGYKSFITSAKRHISNAKLGMFGRDYHIARAEMSLIHARTCLNRAYNI